MIEQTCTELTVHTSIEEQVIYPALAGEVDGDDAMSAHATQEHDDVKEAIAQIESLSYTAADVGEPMQRIIAGVTEHVQGEESQIFPKMRDDIDDDRLNALGDELTAAKTQYQPRLAVNPPS